VRRTATSVTHPFLERLKPVLNIAHRGGALVSPENTRFAFESALREFQCDMLELDVRSSIDDEVVVIHDASVDRTTNGSGEVSGSLWSELATLDAGFHFPGQRFRGQGHRMMLFDELLDDFPNVLMNVEIKDLRTVDSFLNVVKSNPRCLDRLCLGSQLDEVARRLREALPGACMFYPENALFEFVVAAKTRGEVPPASFQVLDLPMFWEGETIVDAEFVSFAKAHHKWVNVWTLDDEAQMKQAIEAGVGGIMSDRPDVLQRVLSRVHP
jgi:glycerophosphoryl diester phosphodiesterase